MEKKKEKILFIVNPISGVGRQKNIATVIKKELDLNLFDYTISNTQYAHHATELCLDAVGKYDIVVAVGGDGSINDCVRGLAHSNVILAIVPLGSGNGLARNLNIPLTAKEAIQVINRRKILEIDTIQLNSMVYASVAGVGFDALVAKEFALSKTRGFQTYLKLCLFHYLQYETATYELEIDGKPVKMNALFICFANSNQFGYNTIIAPKAKLNDGYLDVIVVKKIPLALLPHTARLLFFKEFDKSDYVTTYRAKNVKLFNKMQLDLNVDGEYQEVSGEVQFSVSSKSLKVIVP